MRFSLGATAALVAGAAAHGGHGHKGGDESEPMVTVTDYTTFCPEPTTISHGSQTHIVTEVSTLSGCLRGSSMDQG